MDKEQDASTEQARAIGATAARIVMVSLAVVAVMAAVSTIMLTAALASRLFGG